MAKRFYKSAYGYLALGLVIVAVGFSNSYFTKLTDLSFPYHLHGISASIWMLLLVIQPYLYTRGNLKLHRFLGWISLVLVPLIVIGGVIMMSLMIHRQANYPPNTVYKLAFIDFWTLLGFLVVYMLAIYHRKKLKLHARFMVCTIFGPLNPALTRVFFALSLANSFNEALTYSYLLIEIVLIYLLWKERKLKEIRYTYLPYLLFTVLQHVLMYFSNNWKWWVSFMDAMTGYNL